MVDIAKVVRAHEFFNTGEGESEAIKPLKRANRMLLRVGHQVGQAYVNIAISSPVNTANMCTTIMLQRIFKIMIKDKVLTPSEVFHPSYPAPDTHALITYFNGFWDTLQLYAEGLRITFLRTSVVIEQWIIYSTPGFKKMRRVSFFEIFMHVTH